MYACGYTVEHCFDDDGVRVVVLTGSNFARGVRSATSSSAVSVVRSLTRPKSNGCVSLVFLLHIILTASEGGRLWRYTYPSTGLDLFRIQKQQNPDDRHDKSTNSRDDFERKTIYKEKHFDGYDVETNWHFQSTCP